MRSRRGLASIGAALETATLFRRGVLALAGLGIAGTVVELIFLRHWSSATAAIVWVGIVALGAGFVGLLRNPSAARLRAVRILAAVGVVISVLGVGLHVRENLEAGPLDRAYASTWDTMPALDQWWTAVTGGVGPAPTLAPGALAEISLALLLATLRHPATSRPAATGSVTEVMS